MLKTNLQLRIIMSVEVGLALDQVDLKVGGGGGGGSFAGGEDEENESYGGIDLTSNMVVGNMLEANSFEFGLQQWNQIKSDKSNKNISMALKQQAEMRYLPGGPGNHVAFPNSALKKEDTLSIGNKYQSGILYKYQRDKILEKLQISLDGKTTNPNLIAVFPKYDACTVKPISLTVQCDAQDGKKKITGKKSISVIREIGYEKCLELARTEFGKLGLSKTLFIKLYRKTPEGANVDLDDVELVELEDKDTIYLTQDQTKIDEIAGAAEADAKAAKSTKPSSPRGTPAASGGGGGRSGRPGVEMPQSAPVVATASSSVSNKAVVVERRFQNSIKMVEEDAKLMVVPISNNIKFKYPWSQLSLMCYWAGRVLNFMHGFYIDPRNGLALEVDGKEFMNCVISLQRAIADLESVCPEALVNDAKALNEALLKRASEKFMNLTTMLMSDYHELIEKSKFDEISPKSMKLYSEQSEVLDLIYSHMRDLQNGTKDPTVKSVVGYRVPPSGGKTMLSVCVASMLGKNFPRQKRVLYVCYNTLVRMAVANACEHTETPYWVASTRTKPLTAGLGCSQIVTSFTCRDNSLAARRLRRAQAPFADKFGSISQCWKKANDDTVTYNHIVIADITSAIELLGLYRDEFIVYFDEPTAGAENGSNKTYDIAYEDGEIEPRVTDKMIRPLGGGGSSPSSCSSPSSSPSSSKVAENDVVECNYRGQGRWIQGKINKVVDNIMQEYVAKLLTLLPSLTIMLSATLPDLKTQFPSLVELYGDANIKMVETQRLPVGCVALAPDGSQYLPHQIAESIDEFKEAIRGLQNDSLMLRFYTPGPVYHMSKEIEKLAKKQRPPVVIPAELTYAGMFPNIGSVSHKRIRDYAQKVLNWVANHENGDYAFDVFESLKTLGLKSGSEKVAVRGEDFVEKYIASEGRALAVTTSSKADIKVDPALCKCQFCRTFSEAVVIDGEPLDILCNKAIGKYVERIPNIKKFIQTYEREVEEANKQKEAFLKKGGEDALQKAEEVEMPEFIWPVKIANFSAMLKDEEISALDSDYCGLLLSGLGKYDPATMTHFENLVTMREASNGHLACLFSAPDIVYGTNMSLINVFIGSGYGFNATRNSLYQLIGRAGRTGRSNKARILFEDHHTMKRALLPEPNGKNFEADVMDWHLRRRINASSSGK